MVSKRKKSRLKHKRDNPVLYYVETLFSVPVLIFVGIGALLFFLSMTQITTFETIRGKASNSLGPVVAAVSSPFQAVGGFVSNATGFNAMRAELEQVKRENERLNEWYYTAQILRAENQSFRELLNVKMDGQDSYLTTKLLVDPGSSFIKTVLIDAGSKNGVENGQAVIGEGGFLGRIVETFPDTARVLLMNDINSRIPVLIEGTNQRAILAGVNDKNLQLDFVPESMTVEKGMKIKTSGDGGLIPPGLPVGEIISTKVNRIIVRPYADSEKSYFVRILQKQKSKEKPQQLQKQKES